MASVTSSAWASPTLPTRTVPSPAISASAGGAAAVEPRPVYRHDDVNAPARARIPGHITNEPTAGTPEVK